MGDQIVEKKPGFKKTKLGWIPEDWKVDRLESYIKIRSGNSPSDFNESTEGINFIKVDDLNNSFKYQERGKYLVDKNKDYVPVNSVIFPKRGAAIMNNKVRISREKLFMDSNLMAISPRNGLVEVEYLYYFILQRKLFRIADTSTIPQINNKHINPLKLILPHLPEQKAIASCLSTWDTAITKLDALIKAKQQLKKALMQQLLSGKKRLPGFEGVWEEKRLGMYLEQSLQKVKKENTYEVLTSARSGLVKQSEYYESGRLSSKSSIDFNIINKDELTYRSRTDDGTFKFNLNSLGIDGCVSKYYPVLKSSTSIEFFSYFLNYYNIKIGKFATGSSQLVLSFNELSKIKFYLPEKDEQTAIAQVLNTADQEINLLTAQRNQLQLQKNGLMQQLLTGKMRLKV